MTPLGAFFIPVAIVCFLWKPYYLLPLLIVASVFEAASVFNGAIGGFVFGVSPFYLVEVFVVLRFLLWVYHGGTLLVPDKTPAREIAVLLLGFLAWSFASAIMMPRLFAGMPVYAPRERVDVDIIQGNLAPLRWSLSNLAQGMYLALNVAAVLFALRTIRTKAHAERLAKALRLAVFIVLAAGLLQLVAQVGGLSYPYALFNNNPNNPSDTQYFDQQIEGYIRISSTFSEPMNSGSFLAAMACGLLASYLRGRRGVRGLLAFLGAGFVLLETTSTTGYLTLVVMYCVLLIYFNPFIKSKAPGQQSLLKGWAVVTLTAVCITAAGMLLIPSLSRAVVAMTIEKAEGISFASRVVADLDSFRLFEDTYGLGVGLGSSRPSSIVMTFLSTVGIVGTSLFAMVLYRIIKMFPGRSAPSTLQMSFWSLIGLMAAHSFGIPDINRPALWALLIIAVAQSNVWSIADSSAELGKQHLVLSPPKAAVV